MASNQYGLGELRALSNLIQASVDRIETSLATQGKTFPAANEPFTAESEAARSTPEVENAVGDIVSAASQLIAVSRTPMLTLIATALGVSVIISIGHEYPNLDDGLSQYHVSSAIRAALQAHVPEILTAAGPKVRYAITIMEFLAYSFRTQGLHVKDIAAPAGVNATKLGP